MRIYVNSIQHFRSDGRIGWFKSTDGAETDWLESSSQVSITLRLEKTLLNSPFVRTARRMFLYAFLNHEGEGWCVPILNK
jgi:hypothetical protein